LEYHPQPDRRLVAFVLLAAIVVPGLVAAELAVPSLQPKFAVSSAGGGAATTGGGAQSSVAASKVLMPDGVNLQKTLNFQPAALVLVIGVNNTVTWTNQDSTDHTVTFTAVPSGVKASAISGGDVPPGETFGPITLTVPGTYQYHCQFHPGWMKETIIVKGG
jgi:plastocyanin